MFESIAEITVAGDRHRLDEGPTGDMAEQAARKAKRIKHAELEREILRGRLSVYESLVEMAKNDLEEAERMLVRERDSTVTSF